LATAADKRSWILLIVSSVRKMALRSSCVSPLLCRVTVSGWMYACTALRSFLL